MPEKNSSAVRLDIGKWYQVEDVGGTPALLLALLSTIYWRRDKVRTWATTKIRRKTSASFYSEWRRAKRYQRTLSVILVGINRLQLIADQFVQEGHDALVRGAARVLMSSIRDVDIPGRCRDDVFGAILPEAPVEGAEVADERIRTKLEQYSIPHNWMTITMTASVGAANFPTTAVNLDELFAQSAEALMACTQSDGNAVQFGSGS